MQKPDFSYRKIRVRMGLLSAVGPAIGAAGSIAGGLLGGSAASKAAKKAANIASSQAWTDIQQGERAYEDTQPFRNLGSAAANRLSMLLGLGSLPAVARRYVPQNYNDPFFNQTAAPYLGYGAGDPLAQGRGSTSSGQFPLGDVSQGGNPAYSAISGGGLIGSGPNGEVTAQDIQAAQNAAMGLFQTDPGYEFNLSEGLKAIDRGAAARGGLQSGAALKAEQRYGAGLASQQYQNYLANLFQAAGFGPQATSTSTQASLGFGGLGQTANLAAGNARGSAYASQANQFNGMLTNLTGTLGGIDWSQLLGGSGGGAHGVGW